MKLQLELLTNWKFYIPMILASVSIIWSFLNFLFGKIITAKITQNDLKHLKSDVDKLKEEDKKYKLSLKKELSKIFRRLGKIEKIQYTQKEICNLRHSKDK